MVPSWVQVPTVRAFTVASEPHPATPSNTSCSVLSRQVQTVTTISREKSAVATLPGCHCCQQSLDR
jgi:hypothetical protein